MFAASRALSGRLPCFSPPGRLRPARSSDDPELDPPVPCAPVLREISRDGGVHARPLREEPILGDAEGDETRLHGLGPRERESLIRSQLADVVCVPDDAHADGRVLTEYARHLFERAGEVVVFVAARLLLAEGEEDSLLYPERRGRRRGDGLGRRRLRDAFEKFFLDETGGLLVGDAFGIALGRTEVPLLRPERPDAGVSVEGGAADLGVFGPFFVDEEEG